MYIINNCLSGKEIECLREECTNLNRGHDLSNMGASIDLFEGSLISEDNPIRISEDSFFAERWKQSVTVPDIHSIIKQVILAKLPSLVKLLYHIPDSLFLFNEHYVVKNVDSNLEFRWHTDANEQLPSFPVDARPTYWSVWCPLQDVSPLNGTIAFPSDASILCCGMCYGFDFNFV